MRVVNTEPQTEPFHHVNRQELDTLLDTDAPECTVLVWLQGEVKDALFDQMLKGSWLIARHCTNLTNLLQLPQDLFLNAHHLSHQFPL